MGYIKKLNPKVDKILTLMAEHGFITWEEIVMALQCCSRLAHSYVMFLNRLDFIEKIGPREIFFLTAQAYKYLEESGKLRIKRKLYKFDFNPFQFYHTKIGIQVRLIFESHPWVLDYRPERVIDYYASLNNESVDRYYKRGMKYMDAEVILNLPSGETKAGIEIELGCKGVLNYEISLINIDNNRKDLKFVYWICGNGRILRAVLEALKDLRPFRCPERHFLVTWDKFKQVKFDDYIWTNVNNEAVAILPPPTSPEIQTAKLEPAPEPKLTEPPKPPPTLKEPEPKPIIPPEPEPKQPRLR